MLVLRSDGRRWLAPLVAAGLVILSPAAGLARHLGPPIPLFPQNPPRPERGVQRETLPPPATGWDGDTTPPGAPLPTNFWDGTPRALADILLGHLPTTSSPALQMLERRLLLSRGKAPTGDDAPGDNLPLLRASALLRLGEIGAVRKVFHALPQDKRGPLWPIFVAADGIAGKIGRACRTVRQRIRLDPGVFWQRALIGCQVLEGKSGPASLGLQVLAAEKAPADNSLAAAVRALAGQPAPATINRIAAPDPLSLRALVAADRRLTSPLVRALRPDLALTLALDQKAPAATRLAAAERAARFGALPARQLAALYRTLAHAAGPQGARGLTHARRFAAIDQAPDPADRLSRALRFVRDFARINGFGLAARLVAPSLRDIAPNPALAGSALDAARLLIAAGDSDQARRWIALVPAPENRALTLLLHLAGAARGSGDSSPSSAEMAHSVLSLALFSALGEKVAPTAWVRLPPPSWTAVGQPAGSAASWLNLAEAARARRIGETVLSAILVAGSSGTLSTDPVVLYAAISNLRRVGLDGDARRLALEAALAASL